MDRVVTTREPLRRWKDSALLQSLLGADGEALSLSACVGLAPKELQTRFSLVPQKAMRLSVALELGRRALKSPSPSRVPIRGGEDVYRYLAPRLLGQTVECFCGLYLDAKGSIVFEQELSRGTLTSSLVHPREVLQPALLYRAAAVVVAHNHPSGDPEPSAEDRTTTRRLQRACRLLGIELLDHVVIGHGAYRSFLEEGWL